MPESWLAHKKLTIIARTSAACRLVVLGKACTSSSLPTACGSVLSKVAPQVQYAPQRERATTGQTEYFLAVTEHFVSTRRTLVAAVVRSHGEPGDAKGHEHRGQRPACRKPLHSCFRKVAC